MDMLDKVLVGIVTFNPDIRRLKENIAAVNMQIKNVLIIDNGSKNFKEFKLLLPKTITLLRYSSNMGIAKALCQIMDYAKRNNYIWVLTLDQDSVIESGLLDEYCKYAIRNEFQDVGMFSCLIRDRNFKEEKQEKQIENVIEITYCITSAAFTNVEKYYNTSGYDESFFIDAVDFDICYSLRECGYRVCRINFIGLYHEVGHGENRKFLWKEIVVYHQKPFRIYYLARNTILMNRKHKKMFPKHLMMMKELALFIRILLYENEKSNKMKQFWNGIVDAKK